MNIRSSSRGAASFPPPLAGLVVALSILSLHAAAGIIPPRELAESAALHADRLPWFGDVSTKALHTAYELALPLERFEDSVTAWSEQMQIAAGEMTFGLERAVDRNQTAVALVATDISKGAISVGSEVGQRLSETQAVLTNMPVAVSDTLVAAVTTTADGLATPAQSWWDRVGESLALWADGLINGWGNLGQLLADYRHLIASNWQRFLNGEEPDRVKTLASKPSGTAPTFEETKEQIRQEIEASIRQDLEKTLQQIGQTQASAASFGPGQSLTVFPSTGSSTVDSNIKNQVKNSFSDEVSVQFDETGQSGMITPVFRKSTGSNYLFILTPFRK